MSGPTECHQKMRSREIRIICHVTLANQAHPSRENSFSWLGTNLQFADFIIGSFPLGEATNWSAHAVQKRLKRFRKLPYLQLFGLRAMKSWRITLELLRVTWHHKFSTWSRWGSPWIPEADSWVMKAHPWILEAHIGIVEANLRVVEAHLEAVGLTLDLHRLVLKLWSLIS